MQTQARFFTIASISLALFVLAGSFAKADDTTKKDVVVKETDKNAKAVSDSASKLDLSTPITKVKFYGVATVGYEATFGKTNCIRQNGMYSQLFLGTDIKLSKDVTMSVQMQAGQYPNGYNGFGFR